MTLQRIPGAFPLVWPNTLLTNPRTIAASTAGGFNVLQGAGTMDATGEKVAYVGYVFWADGAASKTMDSTSIIHFRTGSITMADASTTMRIGLQDVNTAAGPPVQPDGTFDVYREFAGDAGVITSADDNVAKSITLSTSGSKTVTNGQLIAVVFDMVARAGSDSLVVNGAPSNTSIGYSSMPASMQYTTSWQNTGSGTALPLVLLESSDGTLGTLLGCGYYAPGSVYTFAAASTPDERALKFQVPYTCKVNSVYLATGGNAATADGELVLYSTPGGTPTALATITVLGEYFGNVTDERVHHFMFDSEITLSAATDYAIAYKATGAGSVNLGYTIMSNAAHRSINGFANCSGVSRSDATGAFGSESTTDIPLMSVGICALDDGSGVGAAEYLLGV